MDEVSTQGNLKIMNERLRLMSAHSADEVPDLVEKYRVNPTNKEEVSKKVAPIPKLITFSQFFQEGGGGVAKTAIKTNNPFGVMEVKRPHRVQRFRDTKEAFHRYAEVLNTSLKMNPFREARESSFGLDILAMAKGLTMTYCQSDKKYFEPIVAIAKKIDSYREF